MFHYLVCGLVLVFQVSLHYPVAPLMPVLMPTGKINPLLSRGLLLALSVFQL